MYIEWSLRYCDSPLEDVSAVTYIWYRFSDEEAHAAYLIAKQSSLGIRVRQARPTLQPHET